MWGWYVLRAKYINNYINNYMTSKLVSGLIIWLNANFVLYDAAVTNGKPLENEQIAWTNSIIV